MMFDQASLMQFINRLASYVWQIAEINVIAHPIRGPIFPPLDAVMRVAISLRLTAQKRENLTRAKAQASLFKSPRYHEYAQIIPAPSNSSPNPQRKSIASRRISALRHLRPRDHLSLVPLAPSRHLLSLQRWAAHHRPPCAPFRRPLWRGRLDLRARRARPLPRRWPLIHSCHSLPLSSPPHPEGFYRQLHPCFRDARSQ